MTLDLSRYATTAEAPASKPPNPKQGVLDMDGDQMLSKVEFLQLMERDPDLNLDSNPFSLCLWGSFGWGSIATCRFRV